MKLKHYLFGIVFILILTSCNDAPTEVGSNFLLDTVGVSANEAALVGAYSYVINTQSERNTGRTLVGMTDDMKAAALMRFNLPVNKAAALKDKIIECKLYLYPSKYAIGDTTGSNNLSFKVQEITAHWNSDSINVDQIFDTDELFVGGRTIAQWEGTIDRKDTTDTAAIVFDFPNDMCYEWLEKIGNGLSIKDTVWGLAIMPQAGSSIINAFRSFNNLTKDTATCIRVKYYSDSANTEIDSFDIITADEYTVVKTNQSYDSTDLAVQGAVRIHSKLSVDISEVAPLACINYGKLTLHVDKEKTQLGNVAMPESIGLQIWSDTATTERLALALLSAIGNYDSTAGTYTFTANMPYMLNYILRSNAGKASIVLTNYSLAAEYNQLDKVVFYGMDAADTSKRPKLIYAYSGLN
jgi:hypothetical protein